MFVGASKSSANSSDGNDQHSNHVRRPVILFDAERVLRSANVRFVLERDQAAICQLASMQGDIGQALCRKHGMDPTNRRACWLWRAIECVATAMPLSASMSGLGFLGLVWIFGILPPSLRDPIYRLVAIKRYRLFGRRNSCWIAPGQYRPHPLTGTAHQADVNVGQKRRRMRVMILGGYGVFGGRLIELPSDIDELVPVVCGRSLEPAREFCALYGGAARVEPLAVDGSTLSKAASGKQAQTWSQTSQDH
ncbi:MAG: DCC1-like thiol-disulfide oxidoreductase family protein [Pseudomonadota bacterium]|nr:DCC1-like thiol-disulfide oxidoreductase family protein [Pseudomonadota bacterium]